MENMKPLFLIKKAVLTAVLAIFGMSSLCSASIYDASAMANRNTLNVLIRRIPIPTRSNGTELRELSSIQELLVIHEQQMKGAGLPPVMSGAFSINYCAIISALVNDEISEDYGRDLLSLHRQMLKRSYQWASRANRDPQFPEEIVNNLLHFQREMAQRKTPVYEVPPSTRTPLINGFQVWVGELLAWGCEGGGLAIGQRTRIQVSLDQLEYFENLYKKDGRLLPTERDNLHGRLLSLTSRTMEQLIR
jgi:hypothetical protein